MANVLGDYLRARRAQLTPAEAGLPTSGVRRVPGLRREEVAGLAGLSVDYYTRLEQGRERHPSVSVLTALARALGLDPDAARYLFAVATPTSARPRPRRAPGQNLLALVDEWPNHPTLLIDNCHNVVAGNQLGNALYGWHDNLARLVFLDTDAKVFFREWPKIAAALVAGMRAAASHAREDAQLVAMIGELTVRSPEFSRLWAKADVREKTSDAALFHHPVVGDLNLVYETFRPNGAPDLLLKVYRAVDVPSREGLAMLGSLTATSRSEHRVAQPGT